MVKVPQKDVAGMPDDWGKFKRCLGKVHMQNMFYISTVTLLMFVLGRGKMGSFWTLSWILKEISGIGAQEDSLLTMNINLDPHLNTNLTFPKGIPRTAS